MLQHIFKALLLILLLFIVVPAELVARKLTVGNEKTALQTCGKMSPKQSNAAIFQHALKNIVN